MTKALDLSSLAKISDGYTPGHMVRVVQSVVTKRRVLQQAKRPLTALEFVPPLAKMDPVFQEEEEALKVNWICHLQFLTLLFVLLCLIVSLLKCQHACLSSQNWYAKTPLGKKRIKAATGKEEEEVPVKNKDVKKKKGKK